MKMKEMVDTNVAVIDVNDSVQEAARMLKRSGVFLLSVESQGRLVGTLSLEDIEAFGARHGDSEERTEVKEVMNYEFIACTGETLGLDVARLAARTNILRLVVMNGQRKAVGILSLERSHCSPLSVT